MPLGARQTRHTMTVLSFSIPMFPRWLETLQWPFFISSVEYLNLEVSDTLKLSVSTPLVLCPSVETFLLQYKVEKVRPQSKCDSDSFYQSWRVCGHHTLSLCLVFCRSSKVWKYLSPVLFLARGALTGVPPRIILISTQNAWFLLFNLHMYTYNFSFTPSLFSFCTHALTISIFFFWIMFVIFVQLALVAFLH